MTDSIKKRIQENFPLMSNNQKLLANYIVQNYNNAAFLTAQELANAVDVSEATVVRFAVALGYKGYPQMVKSIQGDIKDKISTVERLKTSPTVGTDKFLEHIFTTDIDSIHRTMQEVDVADFNLAVEKIIGARNIYILSFRSAISLGHFLHYYLHRLLKNCRLPDASVCFEELMAVQPEDLVIGISFPRYSRQTIEGLRFAHEKGANTVAITDSITSPLALYGETVLIACSRMPSYIDSFVAPLSLINAILVAVGTKTPEKSHQALGQLEEIWDKFGAYYSE